MSEIENGGPAFPSPWGESGKSGITIRDYLAAKAMQSIMQGAVLPTKADRDEHLPTVAGIAYEVADAMLAARSKA